MTGESKLDSRPWSIAAGLIGLVMLTKYLVVISIEGNNSFLEIMPWVLVMAVATAGAFASAFVHERRMARSLALAGAISLGFVGVLALASIGIGLLVGSAVSMVAANRLSEANAA